MMLRRLVAASVVATVALASTGVPALAGSASQAVPQTELQSQAQTPSPPKAPQSPPPSTQLPVDVDKIRSVVDRAPTPLLSYEKMKTRFYVRVNAKSEIRFTDFIGHFDLRNGPVPRAGQTHAEFLAMVTPRELYSAAGIKPTEALEMALTGFLAQSLARKAIAEIRKASTAREIQEIRDRITRELAALSGKK